MAQQTISPLMQLFTNIAVRQLSQQQRTKASVPVRRKALVKKVQPPKPALVQNAKATFGPKKQAPKKEAPKAQQLQLVAPEAPPKPAPVKRAPPPPKAEPPKPVPDFKLLEALHSSSEGLKKALLELAEKDRHLKTLQERVQWLEKQLESRPKVQGTVCPQCHHSFKVALNG